MTKGHLIAGQWTPAAESFANQPVTGAPSRFSMGTPAHVAAAAQAAAEAFPAYAATPRAKRADFLDAIAEAIDARAEAITAMGTAETGLPEARLIGERGRTTHQLRLFATHIRLGLHLDLRHDPALPDRKPAPRPALHMIQRPIGPVAVFGASNFPLAFSTAGGDTAAALAAGCPVVVKGHSAHPGLSELVAEAVDEARRAHDLPRGTFSLIQGGRRDVGVALVTHPAIKAVGFTGSQGAGRMLFDLCAARPEPIPFFGELGSVNPVFVLPHAGQRAAEIATPWAASLTLGAGQFCTNPGLLVLPPEAAPAFRMAALTALQATQAQAMLTETIAAAAHEGTARLAAHPEVATHLRAAAQTRHSGASLFEVPASAVLQDHSLTEEVFGPVGLIVTATTTQALELARALPGQLTATLQIEEADTDTARALLAVLEHKAGRILVNGMPTGVEVADAMVHGGPWPASTNFGATSVGTLSIRRFLRPVCFQNLPRALWTEDLEG